ncbi:MAG: hypothetical protein KDD61_15740 [Bdellovibrionales bacterium]|nr:hypothetical protein [Bdellovibrionales bacterium]
MKKILASTVIVLISLPVLFFGYSKVHQSSDENLRSNSNGLDASVSVKVAGGPTVPCGV